MTDHLVTILVWPCAYLEPRSIGYNPKAAGSAHLAPNGPYISGSPLPEAGGNVLVVSNNI